MLPQFDTPTTTTATPSGQDSGRNEPQHQPPTTSFQDPTHPFSDDFDFDIDSSTCSTPFVSAPSSPGRNSAPLPCDGSFCYSAPASPMHFILSPAPNSSSFPESSPASSTCSFEFDFSARLSTNGTASAGSMSSADELFLNGQIRPMKLSTHLQRPQVLAPLLDLDEPEEKSVDSEAERGRTSKFRDKSMRRRTRSMSPLRTFSAFHWQDHSVKNEEEEKMKHVEESESTETTTNPSDSGASSRSSSAGGSSKKWDFLKEFLYRSKSEGRNNGPNKFWGNLSFSPVKIDKILNPKIPPNESSVPSSAPSPKEVKRKGVNSNSNGKAAANGVWKRRLATPSAHELHYAAKRAEAEEMRKKTFLPYRKGLLGCLGFSSESYGAMNGFARTLNPVPSR